MAGQQQSPSPGSPKKGSQRPPRQPLAQALKKAIESVQEADDVDKGPTGQSPMRMPSKKTNTLQ